jgi:hypothetical protein
MLQTTQKIIHEDASSPDAKIAYGSIGMASTDWALATTPPNAEHLVSADLLRLGYDHKLFKRRSTHVWHGRIVIGMPPAFPRYIMVPLEECWEILRDVWPPGSRSCTSRLTFF